MCGAYDSVIGMEKSLSVRRFVHKLPTERLTVASGPATLCAVLVETDDRSGQALSISPLRLGGQLQQAEPPLG